MQELTPQAVEELKQLAPDSAQVINDEHAALLADCDDSQAKARSAKDRALRIGAELAKVRDATKGRFIAWVETNCSFCRRTASRYIAFHERINGTDGTHVSHVSEDMTLRQAYVALGIVPKRPREGNGTYRGGGAPGVYDALNKLTRLLDDANHNSELQPWEADPDERSAVQRQYKPKLEEFIRRLFGIEISLPASEA